MKIYKFRIKAVKIGYIGNKKLYIITVTADNLKNAVLNLYNTHEHIFIEKVNGVKYDYCNNSNNIL